MRPAGQKIKLQLIVQKKDEADKEYFNQLYYKVDRLSDLENNFRGIIDIMTIWFENYKGKNVVTFEKLGTVSEAQKLINYTNREYKKSGLRPRS